MGLGEAVISELGSGFMGLGEAVISELGSGFMGLGEAVISELGGGLSSGNPYMRRISAGSLET
jgi:hypothetical protein